MLRSNVVVLRDLALKAVTDTVLLYQENHVTIRMKGFKGAHYRQPQLITSILLAMSYEYILMHEYTTLAFLDSAVDGDLDAGTAPAPR